MSAKEGAGRSILIVSSSEQFDNIVKRSLSGFLTIDIRRSTAIARRCILERDYDIIVVNCPMPDEMGVEFAMDAAEKSDTSILLVTPREIYEEVLDRVTDSGILVVSKPMQRGIMDKAIRYLVSIRVKMNALRFKNRKLEEKMEELRIVSKAKILLVERNKMTEDEAHSFIGRQAMNNGVSRRVIAERIIEDL